MEAIQKMFNYNENPVRTIVQEGTLYFVAKDVCDVLEIKNTSDAIKRLDEDERSRFNLGRQGETNIINEAGLYTLILGSKKKEARAFKRWVTHDVIPSIRKHGAYMTDSVLDSAINDPDLMIGLLEKLKQERLQRGILEKKIEIDEPKVMYYDSILASDGSINISQISKDYGLSGQALNKILYEEGVQYKIGGQWVLYRKHHGKGFTRSVTAYTHGNFATIRTQWTQKGRLFIHDILTRRGHLPVSDVR